MVEFGTVEKARKRQINYVRTILIHLRYVFK